MELITVLGGIKTALDDNEITIQEAFPLPQKEAESGSVAQTIKDHFAGSTEKEPPMPEKAKKAERKKITPQHSSAEPNSAHSQAPVGEPDSAGSGEADPTPSEELVGYQCTCGRRFPELVDGKCPHCYSMKVTKL